MKKNRPPDIKAIVLRSSLEASGLDRPLFRMTKTNPRHTTLLTALITTGFISGMGSAQAALVSTCTGVSLPQSVVTDIVGSALLPAGGVIDTIDTALGGLLGLNTNLTNTLNGIAAGDPITLSVLDINGNAVDVLADPVCITTSDGYQMNDPQGISMGGNQITGLGDGATASAGEINSIAIGNGASTDPTAANSIAIGPNATVGPNATDSIAIGSGASATAANSVAMGAGSTATRGAQTNYQAYALDTPQNSAGEFSVGSPGFERQITNVAPGSAGTDAVNVNQLAAVNDGAVKYDLNMSKTLITLEGAGGTRITNVSRGTISATSTDAVNGSQLYEVSSQFNGQINNLYSEIDKVNKNANAGAAASMAMASMPQSVLPGKAMLTAAMGHYEGQSAMAVGVSNFSENGRWVVNFNGSANTRGKVGAGVGVGIHW